MFARADKCGNKADRKAFFQPPAKKILGCQAPPVLAAIGTRTKPNLAQQGLSKSTERLILSKGGALVQLPFSDCSTYR